MHSTTRSTLWGGLPQNRSQFRESYNLWEEISPATIG
jgi:hypothetical protein